MEKTVSRIPARYASTRLCGKLLMEVDNKPIIQWVWEAAKKSKLADEVIIAADSELILEKAQSFGARVEMTSKDHKSGSDRICEVAKRHDEYSFILNIQTFMAFFLWILRIYIGYSGWIIRFVVGNAGISTVFLL